MKRTLLALVVASLSFAAFAGSPPTAGPVNVRVVSPLPLPVSAVPAMVPMTELRAASGYLDVVGAMQVDEYVLNHAAALRGFTVSIKNSGIDNLETCYVSMAMVKADNSTNRPFFYTRLVGDFQQPLAYIPLPADISLEPGDKIALDVATEGARCTVNAGWYLLLTD